MSSSTISRQAGQVPRSSPLLSDEKLERRLEELLHQDRFAPPAHFVAGARVNDASLHARAELDPDAFWAEQARNLHWDVPFTTVLDDSKPPFYKWFVDGKLNVSYNCLDRHVEAGRGNRVALHWAGEEGERRAITYAELHRDVQRLANALRDLGVGKGDVVGIYLPMIPEVVVAMLACARIGAPHNVVFGGFAPEAVRERMDVSRAKVLITVDGARRKGKTAPIKAAVDAVMDDRDSLEHIVVVRHTRIDTPMAPHRDVFYDEIMGAAEHVCPAEPMEAEHPLFILYSSGSTAKPKGIVHTTGGYLTGVSSTHRYVFDLDPERDVYFCSADVGWVTGHSYIVYGPLANGATSVMYEGAPDYPHKGIWWELCERYGVSIFYTAPTAIRACMKWGVEHPNAHDLSSLRLLGTVGEPINPKAWLLYHVVIGRERCPIVDTWWQTETGQIMISPLPGLTETKPGSATFALPGVLADVVDETTGQSVEQGQGLLVLKRPWPGMLRTLYGDDDRYVETYWSRFGNDTYLVGDAAIRDKDGYLWIVGRIDDVINVAGHRLSTAEVESAIVAHHKVAEAAVVAQSDELTGQAIVAYVTLQGELEGTPEIEAQICAHVAEQIGKLARPKRILWSEDLPKTRSGKIMRRLLRDIAEGRTLGDVTTLRDPDVMAELEQKVMAAREREE
ncbi:MAG: acetyl-CoA synthetase [Solirubrobacteraceae bacterium]|nr:acetyl-CoA synthetase [Solirubrobacteraceae bacterium]